MSDIDCLRKILSGMDGIEKVGGDIVPLPSATGEMSDHLFVNLTLCGYAGNTDPSSILSRLRSIALAVYSQLAVNYDAEPITTVILSIFAHLNMSDNIRIYRTRVCSEDLCDISESNFTDLVTGEESADSEIQALFT